MSPLLTHILQQYSVTEPQAGFTVFKKQATTQEDAIIAATLLQELLAPLQANEVMLSCAQ